jgi:hypothetical protein
MVRPKMGARPQKAGKVSTLLACAAVEVASSVFAVAKRIRPNSSLFS